jgi:hypothetical protein
MPVLNRRRKRKSQEVCTNFISEIRPVILHQQEVLRQDQKRRDNRRCCRSYVVEKILCCGGVEGDRGQNTFRTSPSDKRAKCEGNIVRLNEDR